MCHSGPVATVVTSFSLHRDLDHLPSHSCHLDKRHPPPRPLSYGALKLLLPPLPPRHGLFGHANKKVDPLPRRRATIDSSHAYTPITGGICGLHLGPQLTPKSLNISA
ncbi:hypothetical protein FRC12_003143 [Ceratobasidium sp. 428]|nr:hypothetical protein FRC12_003143 [Ceratobasidium sp. 428]